MSLHGLVVSSGELRQVSPDAFTGLSAPLQALGLPNNLLDVVPSAALRSLSHLERLDLSHNRLQRLHNTSFEVSAALIITLALIVRFLLDELLMNEKSNTVVLYV